MEAIAKHNKVTMSARKARLVANLVRGMEVQQALSVLKNKPQKASPIIYKLLLSAINNWTQKQGDLTAQKNTTLYIKEIFVNIGKVLKRIQPAPQGRAHPIRKPSCHINIVVTDRSVIPLQTIKSTLISKQKEEVMVSKATNKKKVSESKEKKAPKKTTES
ncbi:MAG: 50S ribosomal protein L22 [Bacteroidota bacterium]